MARSIEPLLALLAQRLGDLELRLNATPDEDALESARHALSELALAVEEVHVVGEELALQGEELDHRSVEAERDRLRLHDLFDHAPIALLATDRHGVIEEANEEAGRLLGRPAAALLGHHLSLLVMDEDQRKVLRLASRVRRSARVIGSFSLRHPSGTPVPVAVGVTGDAGESGGPRHLRWSFHDSTASEDREARLQATVDDLERARAGQEAFLLGVAHDLRSPISTIMTLVEATLAVDASRDTLHTTLVQVGASARALDRLQTDLVDLERLARHALRPYRRPVALDDVVTEEVKAMDHGGRTVELDVRPVVLDADPGMVRSIVRKLVDNALTHTPPDTTVTITIDSEGGRASIVVADDGPGIPEVDRESVFELFWQGAGGRRAGLGAGLHLVRRFAELHGGTATVGPSDTGGARFEVTLETTA